MSALFSRPLSVLNAGLASFADAIAQRGGKVVQIDWAPPASGDRRIAEALPTARLP